jgi:hypothetical protein
MSSDQEEFNKLIELMRKSNQESLDINKRDVQTYYESMFIGTSKLKMILDGLCSDIHGLEKRKLDHEMYFVILAQKIISMEGRISQNIKNVLELSKCVKETESFQDELSTQLRKSQEEAKEFSEIAKGITQIVDARKKEIKDEDKGENQTDGTK